MSKFIYRSIPDDLATIIREYFEAAGWAVPAWCQHVNVYWQAEADEGCALETRVNFEYRFAEVWVHPVWLEAAAEMKRDNVLHEMIHLHVNPMFDYANNTIGMLLHDDEKFKVHAQEALRRFAEGSVQDLTDTIFARIHRST